MQINRTGIFLIGFFGIAGLALCVVPMLLGANAEMALIIGSTGFIWFLVAMGLVFPPVGMIAFVVAATGNVALTKVYKGTSILMLAIILTTVLIMLFPELVLWLPRTMK